MNVRRAILHSKTVRTLACRLSNLLYGQILWVYNNCVSMELYRAISWICTALSRWPSNEVREFGDLKRRLTVGVCALQI